MSYDINKKNIAVLVLISIIISYILLKSDLKSIFIIIAHANIGWFLLGIVSILIYWMIEAKTLHLMLLTYDKNFSYLEVLKLVVTTQFFNGITPFSTGGQPFQIYMLSKRSKIGVSSITSAAIHNFIVYQIVLVIMGVIAFTLRKIFNMFPMTSNTHLYFIAILGFVLNVLIIFSLIIITVSPNLTSYILKGIYFIISLSPFKKKLPLIQIRLNLTVKEFHKDILRLLEDKPMYIKALLLNVFKLISFYMVAFFICKSVGFDDITIFQSLVASAFVMLITSFVPIPGAAGGAEMAFLLLFSSFLVGPQAMAVMLLWRFITYYFGLFVGLLTFHFGYQSLPTSHQ